MPCSQRFDPPVLPAIRSLTLGDMRNPSFVIVSPVRNEEQYLQLTIDSVARQTCLPAEWLLVDDGSSDKTWSILQANAKRYDWIRPLKRPDRGFRQSGAGVVDAFYDGFQKVGVSTWEFVLKLDADLSFEPDYFANCFAEFDKDPKLGIGGGNICSLVAGALESESKADPKFHVRGAVKIYRRTCWDQIGGIVRGPCWDSIDELHANMLGWTTRTFPGLKVHHHRPAGQAFGKWKDWVKGGRGNYVSGYHPLFMFLKCLRRFPQKPVGFAACGLLYGFVSGYLTATPRLVDRQLMRYIRSQQVLRLTGRPGLWSE
jgi:poly-beta-1,6-N-acetyl-D-glucosamine synthase